MTPTLEQVRQFVSYDESTGEFTWRQTRGGTAWAGTRAGTIRPDGYRIVTIAGSRIRAHRLAWFYHYGHWPTAELDHINGDPSDNRIANLREATRAENMQNTAVRSDNSSGHPGVSWDVESGRWQAKIAVGGHQRHLGRYRDFDDAVVAYRAAKATQHTFHPTVRAA